MIIIPAIDIKDGKCVRLRQGKMDDCTVFNADPVAQAKTWENSGAQRIHIVDLDGSIQGRPAALEAITAIASNVGIPIEVGGGIRNRETVEKYLQAGVQFCIIGTKAAKNPHEVRELLRAFPGRIAIGIDALNGKVAVEGWTAATNSSAAELAQEFDDLGPAAFIYTDISKDGMMQGPNIPATRQFADSVTSPVILSGGVTTIDDLRNVFALRHARIMGIIIGRALYEKTIDLSEAVRLAQEYAG